MSSDLQIAHNIKAVFCGRRLAVVHWPAEGRLRRCLATAGSSTTRALMTTAVVRVIRHRIDESEWCGGDQAVRIGKADPC
jgi:hypothetical protein